MVSYDCFVLFCISKNCWFSACSCICLFLGCVAGTLRVRRWNDDRVQELLGQSIAPSTRVKYTALWRRWETYCRHVVAAPLSAQPSVFEHFRQILRLMVLIRRILLQPQLPGRQSVAGFMSPAKLPLVVAVIAGAKRMLSRPTVRNAPLSASIVRQLIDHSIVSFIVYGGRSERLPYFSCFHLYVVLCFFYSSEIVRFFVCVIFVTLRITWLLTFLSLGMWSVSPCCNACVALLVKLAYISFQANRCRSPQNLIEGVHLLLLRHNPTSCFISTFRTALGYRIANARLTYAALN